MAVKEETPAKVDADAVKGEKDAAGQGSDAEGTKAAGSEAKGDKGKTGEADDKGKGKEKTDEEKAAAVAAEKAKPPEKYDLKVPKDSKLDDDAVGRIAAFAKEQGLSNDAAQSLLEREHDAVSRYNESLEASLDEKADEWMEEAKKDKEIGGDDFKKNAELSKRVLDRYAPESFRKILDESGYGNHPDLVRTFVRIGKAMSEDQLVKSGGKSGGKKTLAERLYPNHPKTK